MQRSRFLRLDHPARVVLTLALMAMSAFSPAVLAQDATPAPVGGTAGNCGIGDPYFPLLGNSGFKVLHNTLDLNFDFRGLAIDVLTVDGQAATFTRHGGELTVAPAAPLTARMPFTTEVAWHCTPLGQDAPT